MGVRGGEMMHCHKCGELSPKPNYYNAETYYSGNRDMAFDGYLCPKCMAKYRLELKMLMANYGHVVAI